MAKYTPPPLQYDETRLKPYDKLSRGAKQEMDLERRAALKKAQKAVDDGESVGRNVADGVAMVLEASPMNLSNRDKSLDTVNMRAARAQKREDELKRAKDAADYKDVANKGNRYSDTRNSKYDEVYGKDDGPIRPYKEVDNVKGYAKGGKVGKVGKVFRGYGIAKKV